MLVFKLNPFTYSALLDIIFRHILTIPLSLSLLLARTLIRTLLTLSFLAPTIIIMFERSICTRLSLKSHISLSMLCMAFLCNQAHLI